MNECYALAKNSVESVDAGDGCINDNWIPSDDGFAEGCPGL
jgi:hypothetical protein